MWSLLAIGVYSKTHNMESNTDRFGHRVYVWVKEGIMKNVRAGPRYRDPRCCKLLRSQIRLKPLGYVNVREA